MGFSSTPCTTIIQSNLNVLMGNYFLSSSIFKTIHSWNELYIKTNDMKQKNEEKKVERYSNYMYMFIF